MTHGELQIRPYANPTETYQYYKLPFCKPKERQWDDHDLGELLTGSRKVVTDYRFYFGVDQTYAQLCRLQMTPDTMKAFTDAVDEDYEISFLLITCPSVFACFAFSSRTACHFSDGLLDWWCCRNLL